MVPNSSITFVCRRRCMHSRSASFTKGCPLRLGADRPRPTMLAVHLEHMVPSWAALKLSGEVAQGRCGVFCPRYGVLGGHAQRREQCCERYVCAHRRGTGQIGLARELQIHLLHHLADPLLRLGDGAGLDPVHTADRTGHRGIGEGIEGPCPARPAQRPERNDQPAPFEQGRVKCVAAAARSPVPQALLGRCSPEADPAVVSPWRRALSRHSPGWPLNPARPRQGAVAAARSWSTRADGSSGHGRRAEAGAPNSARPRHPAPSARAPRSATLRTCTGTALGRAY